MAHGRGLLQTVVRLFSLVVWLPLSLTGLPSRAAATLLVDGSFETPAVGGSTFNCFVLAGCFGYDIGSTVGAWTVFGPDAGTTRSVLLLSNSYSEGSRLFTAEDGNQSIDLTGAGNLGANGVEQTLALDPGTYALSFWIGRQGSRSSTKRGASSSRTAPGRSRRSDPG